MAFAQTDVDALLARTGRMCAICNRLHGVQVHHIVPRHAGGSDEAGNAIPLCPNCHDEVHIGYAPGRITRRYTSEELRGHLDRTIELATHQAGLSMGNDDWEHDVALMTFYAQCLDRPAFRTHFHNELSFADLDQALEDTVLAINTGMWRTRDGTLIQRAAGKRVVVNPRWRGLLDQVVDALTQARHDLRQAFGLNEMLEDRGRHGRMDFHEELRSNRRLGQQLDADRQRALDRMNAVLSEADLPLLPRLGDWS
jgi:hypothetical protein